MLFTEITGVLEHDVEDNLHSALVGGVNHILEFAIGRFVTGIHFREVDCMVTVIVET